MGTWDPNSKAAAMEIEMSARKKDRARIKEPEHW